MILGFIQVFNEVNWIGYAIEQAVSWCDKILIVEGSQFVAFPDIPERSDDGTLDIINDKARLYPEKINIINTTREYGNYRHNQCANFNAALEYCKIGDYFVQLDADEFFLKEWIIEATELMKEGIDFILTPRRNFTFSFKWQVERKPETGRPIIAKNIVGFRFIPTHKWVGINKNLIITSTIGLFHYMWVKPPERLKIRARTGRKPNMIMKWVDEIWMNIKPEDGKIYPYCYGDMKLHEYNDKHPSILDDHPWRHIEDVRTL